MPRCTKLSFRTRVPGFEKAAGVIRIRTTWCAGERPSPTSPALHRARACRSTCSPPASTCRRTTRRTSTAPPQIACSDGSGRPGRTRRCRRRQAGRSRRVRARAVPADASNDSWRSARVRHVDRPSRLSDAACCRPRPPTGSYNGAACGSPGQEGGADGRVSTSAEPGRPDRSSTRRSRLLAVAVFRLERRIVHHRGHGRRHLWHDGGAQRRRSRHLTSSAHRDPYAHPGGPFAPESPDLDAGGTQGAADSTHRGARTARRSVNGRRPRRSEIGRATSS